MHTSWCIIYFENSQALYVKNIQTILDNIGLSLIFRNQIPGNII